MKIRFLSRWERQAHAMRIIFAAMALCMTPNFARGEAEACSFLTDAKDRARCYEAVLGKEGAAKYIESPGGNKTNSESDKNKADAPAVESNWKVEISQSKLDDSDEVVVSSVSKGYVIGAGGDSEFMLMTVRCAEDNAVVYFTFADHFMTSNPGGWVDYRIDRKKASGIQMNESSDHEALGIWETNSTRKFLDMLKSANNLFIRATPYSASPVSTEFDIRGLHKALVPLRKACKF